MKKKKRLIPVFLYSPVYADNFRDGLDGVRRGDYKTAIMNWNPLAEQEHAIAPGVLGVRKL